MELKNGVEDRFSGHHPSFPVNSRIAIVGGGPSGLSAAYALCKLGYNDVTVLEKYHTVSGMCESVDIEGKIYDLGGQVLAANSAPTIFHLAKETGSELEEMDSHKLALIDSYTRDYKDIQVVEDYSSLISLTLEIQDKAKDSGRNGVHGVSSIASDLTPEFLEKRGFESVPKSVAYGYTASGYGYVQDMPYAYVHEFTRTSMAGKIRRFKDGYMSLWQKISESLPAKVLCNTEVLAIRRKATGIEVELRNSKKELEIKDFDKIIISGAFPFANGSTYRSSISDSEETGNLVMDFSENEKLLFSKVQTIDYYTTVLKIKGLEHLPVGFYYFGEFMDDPATIGNPVAMQRFYGETDIFLFWSYGNSSDIVGPTITKLAIDVVQRIGGIVEKVVLQRRFKYFPHIKSKDMKDGFYDRVDTEIQGQHNTYYVGGLMAFELTERNSSYSMSLVCKHFANTETMPSFPYVKRLFPLYMDCQNRKPQKLDEDPGVEFPDLSTLDGYLKHWGSHCITKNKTIYTWLNEDGNVVASRTYAELHANASSIAEILLTNQKPIIAPGDRVLLVHVPGLDFVDAFFGCLRARVLPVPVLPPDPLQRGGQALLKIENIAKASNAVAILSTTGYHTAVRAGAVKNYLSLSPKNQKNSARWPNLPWLHTDSWIRKSKGTPHWKNDYSPEPQGDDLCFLQFTSGSTGDAKGVMITHGGLIHNVKLMKRRYKSTSNTVLVSWLPQYHDMGLIGGLFTALVSGGSAVLFSPITFIKNPLSWLEVITRYRATHSAGPNFAFELVTRRLEVNKDKLWKYDLSSMVFFMIAAEPVRQRTVRRFLELTIPLGLSQWVMAPGYGLAENCVFVDCAYGEENPIMVDWQGRVCCGYVTGKDTDVDIRTVDPDTSEEHLENGKEGEIWISSPSSGIGYWGSEELSERTFRNTLKGHDSKRYTRTGDLGRIIDGHLFITGRIKDLVIVAGRNIYLADVEKTVESSSDLLRPGCCAVIGVPEEILSTKGLSAPDNSDQIGLVVVAEVRDGKSVPKDVIDEIQSKVIEEHGVAVACVKLIKPRTLSKTTSGKIKRFDCLNQFKDGTLNLVPDPILTKRSLVRSFTTGTCRAGLTPRPLLKVAALPSPTLSSDGPRLTNTKIVEFLKKLVSEQTGIPLNKISTTDSLVSYGIDSIGVVRAAQKLSDFLGVPVGAVDIFTSTSIQDLADFSWKHVSMSEPQYLETPSSLQESECHPFESMTETPISRRLIIMSLQFFALMYVSAMLILPAYLSIYVFKTFIFSHLSMTGTEGVEYITVLALAPLTWILCMFTTCMSLSLFGNLILQPNYALTPEVSIWSVDFVKWWALHKAQETASKVLAVHLKGTVFLTYWFQMLGARIGSSVLLDTVDITDPALVSIANETVIAEGALIQGHDVRNEILSFLPIRIGKGSVIGPYAMIQKGSNLKEKTEVAALQRNHAHQSSKSKTFQKKMEFSEVKEDIDNQAVYHLIGIYIIGSLSAIAAAILYYLYIMVTKSTPSIEHFAFLCVSGTLHFVPFTMVAYATMIDNAVNISPFGFAISAAIAYLVHGLILIFLSSFMAYILSRNKESNSKTWLRNHITEACHLRLAKLLSGTEAFCIYLRCFGAKVGKHCSIRAINSSVDPSRLLIGDGVHLGDFSRLVTGFYSSDGKKKHNKVEIHDNVVVGSQSIVLPGSVLEKDVILGALSVAPENSVLKAGGVYIGSEKPVMIKNRRHALDERIEEMDTKYKKIVGNLAANLAATTLKVKTRYFHRIGASGKGMLKIYDNIKGLPDHKMFYPGKCYPVIIRHSNSLSADDDARIDARGAALRILSNGETETETPLLDLTLKTGNAFYARTISDFATWLVCGLAAREEHVKRSPHVRDAVWTSLRKANSFTELHYYSNICRLFRFKDGNEKYVKFKLRPFDVKISENAGRVEPNGILPPETGAIPRDSSDKRPLLFLADDFRQRVSSQSGVRYVLQLQIQPVPQDEVSKDRAVDCTRPWDETKHPYIDVGEMIIDQTLTTQQSEDLEFNPYIRCHEVDVIRATSASQSASIDHGRSLIYEICQHLRNGEPIPEAWRDFIVQSDVKIDLSGCPIAASALQNKQESSEMTLKRTWYQTLWSISAQPLLQTLLPYYLLFLVICIPLNHAKNSKDYYPLPVLLPLFWVFSGTCLALATVIAKWILVGKKKDGETASMWSKELLMDTIWQAFKTLTGEYIMEMTRGSVFFSIWMNLMGSDIEVSQGVYIDSMGVSMNPEMVEIKRGGIVGKDALLFGHIYDGKGGMVKFGKIKVGENGYVGSRAVIMPGVRIENGGCLDALSLAMKGEILRPR